MALHSKVGFHCISLHLTTFLPTSSHPLEEEESQCARGACTMGRGRTLQLSYTALLAFLRAASPVSASSIWAIHIDESPAPPPSQGPPFSAHASRNRALIPYQVIGIVGAYIGAVLLIGSLLATIGRSRRKRALRMASEPTEMVKPISNTYTFEQSPVSPGGGSARHWYSPRSRVRDMKSVSGSMRSATEGEEISPSVASVASFDTTVLEADRRRRQVEMERLYAAVLAQDEARNPESDEEVVGAAHTTDVPPQYSRKQPARLATPATNWQPAVQQQTFTTESTPKTPVRAIYPPDRDLPPGPESATSPVKASFHHALPTQQQQQPPESRPSHTRNPSSSSLKAAYPTPKPINGSKIRKSLRNIKISSPLPYAEDDTSDNDRTPLSPRYYTDPGPPPDLPTPGTSRSAAFPPDSIRDVPLASPQRQAYQQQQQQQLTDLTSQNPTLLPQRNQPHALPLRELNRQYALQQSQPHPSTATARAFPLSPGHWNPLSPNRYATSAGPTKTTFLEARRDNFSSSGPRTGVPTPYSPYMPFTPLTPVTPHLTSKAERKQREREQRKFRRPIVEEEMVVQEGDLWGDGYS